MKKSLLLSIVMTLVLVVAMSTATFAWYTSGKSVKANAATITASTSGSELTIANFDGENASNVGTSINLGTATLDPMIATAEVKTATTFKTYTTNGVQNSAGVSANAYSEQIQIANTSNAPQTQVTITADPGTGALQSFLRYVIVDSQGTVVLNSEYNIDDGAGNIDGEKVVSQSNAGFTLSGTAPETLTIIVWLEGVTMTNANQSQTASIGFSFAGTPVA